VAGLWQSARKFLYRRILHADDTPHRIALGVALATFVALTPTVGLQTVLALGIAALFRANKAVCIPIVWITNPVTMGPIYGACWWLGSIILPGSPASDFTSIQHRLDQLTTGGVSWLSQILSYDFWIHLFGLVAELGRELWVGCLVVGAVLGIVLYFLTLWGVTGYRRRRAAHLLHRLEHRRRRMAKKKLITTSARSESA